MVCISCVFIPIGIWLWFEFVMPILLRLKSLVWGTPQEETKSEENKAKDAKDMKCPFGFSQKTDTSAENPTACATTTDTDNKKEN